MPLVRHPHNFIKLCFLQSLDCLKYKIDRKHWKFGDESGVPGENVR